MISCNCGRLFSGKSSVEVTCDYLSHIALCQEATIAAVRSSGTRPNPQPSRNVDKGLLIPRGIPRINPSQESVGLRRLA